MNPGHQHEPDHHEHSESDGWEFTQEVIDVACALIWSAARRDDYPGAFGREESN